MLERRIRHIFRVLVSKRCRDDQGRGSEATTIADVEALLQNEIAGTDLAPAVRDRISAAVAAYYGKEEGRGARVIELVYKPERGSGSQRNIAHVWCPGYGAHVPMRICPKCRFYGGIEVGGVRCKWTTDDPPLRG